MWCARCSRIAARTGSAYFRGPPDPARLAMLPESEPRLDGATLDPALREVVARAASWHANTYGGGFGCRPSERELVCHVTVPLLTALGWPCEQIAVEWRRADVAVFDDVHRDPAACRIVVEVKRLGDGLGFAHRQAARYAGRLPRPVDLLITDGVRYRFYAGARPDAPPLYAHLANLREPAMDLFEALRPR
jgi:hypothetical protein